MHEPRLVHYQKESIVTKLFSIRKDSLMKSPRGLSVLFIALISAQVCFSQLPKPGADFHAAGSDGGWTWYNEPKAVYYEGTHKRTYFGWVNQRSSDGRVRVAMFDHETNETVVTVMKTKYGADDHAHPALHMRPDGRILVCYTGHSLRGRGMSVAISKDPEDISTFSSDEEMFRIDTMAITYPNILFLSDEGTQGRFYLFFRGLYNMPCWVYSDDWGKTWSRVEKFFHSINAPENHRPYFKYCSNGKDEIHMIIEAWHRRYNPPVYYMKYKQGAFYKANGERVGDTNNLPIYNNLMDTLWNADRTRRTMTCWDIALDDSGFPVFVADIFRSSSDNNDWSLNHIYYYYRWDGTKWFNKRLLNAGHSMGGEAGFASGLTLDHENPNIVYISRQYGVLRDSLNFSSITDETHEIEKWVTSDKGVTWDTIPITRNSAKKNTRPCVPRGHKTGGKFELMWMYGDYTAYGAGGFPDRINFYPYDEVVSLAEQPQRHAEHPSSLNLNHHGIMVSLVNPAESSLLLYGLDGRLIADYTSVVRRMKAGAGRIAWSELGSARGCFVVELNDGGKCETRNGFHMPY